jgi:hypothetical protein
MKTKPYTKKQRTELKRRAHMKAQFEIAIANGACISFHNTEFIGGSDVTRLIKEGRTEWL